MGDRKARAVEAADTDDLILRIFHLVSIDGLLRLAQERDVDLTLGD